MICIQNDCTNPHFNLAAEEYVLTHFSEDVFMLWRNAPSIIIGKFQNTLAEINLDYVREHDITVVRRMTGGGAVFHDLGNLNFTFVQNGTDGDFRSFTEPILGALHEMGVNAEFQGRNDLAIEGKKISGNAECIHNHRMLHHGTLLFSVMMNSLADALKVNPLKFVDKAVKSVRKRVTNISEYLPTPMTIMEFRDTLMTFVVKSDPHCTKYQFSEEDLLAINKLKEEKYDTWEWNFGASPRSSYNKIMRTNGGNVEVCIQVKKGLMEEVKFFGDFFSHKDLTELEAIFKNHPYTPEEINKLLQGITIEDYLCNVTKEEVKALMI